MAFKQKYKFVNIFWQETTSYFINEIPSNTEDTLYSNKNATLEIIWIVQWLYWYKIYIIYHELLYRDICLYRVYRTSLIIAFAYYSLRKRHHLQMNCLFMGSKNIYNLV